MQCSYPRMRCRMRGAALLIICVIATACVRKAWAGRAPVTGAKASSERRVPAADRPPSPAPDDIFRPTGRTRHAPPCRGDDTGRGCPAGMAQMASAEPQAHIIPIPGCRPGLPSTDWTSCSYTQQTIGGVPCIPLAMCTHLRAYFAAEGGGSSLSTWQRHGASRAAFPCWHTSPDGAPAPEAREPLHGCVRASCSFGAACYLLGRLQCRGCCRHRRTSTSARRLTAAHAGLTVIGEELSWTACR
jgi:hypothetical protein